MADQDNSVSERWLNDARIGIIGRPEVRFALPMLLEHLDLTPEAEVLEPRQPTATARVYMSQHTSEYQRRIQGEIGDKLFRLLKVDALVGVKMEPDNEHAVITVTLDTKGRKP